MESLRLSMIERRESGYGLPLQWQANNFPDEGFDRHLATLWAMAHSTIL
jgi:hypothetical protein